MRCIGISILVLWLAAPTVNQFGAQLAAPRIGCFTYKQANYEILGVPANWIVRTTETCAPVVNNWHIVTNVEAAEENAAPWLERRNATSDAVESRRRLEPGTWAVFADGTLVQFDVLHLPGALQTWNLVAINWMLVRTDQALLLVRADGEWFYLPEPDATQATIEGAPAP